MSLQFSSARVLAGRKAFSGLSAKKAVPVSNGGKVFMGRKDSYMVEVNVGEDEPEDVAVRKFMKKVMDSRVLEQLRDRRYQEKPRDVFKRRVRQRIEKIKTGFLEPTYESEVGFETDPKPFGAFFDDELAGQGFFDSGMNPDFLTAGGYLADSSAQAWGGYINDDNRSFAATTEPAAAQ